MFWEFEGLHFGCVASIRAGLEVYLKVEGEVHLSAKDGSTESLGSEAVGICSGFLSDGEHPELSW